MTIELVPNTIYHSNGTTSKLEGHTLEELQAAVGGYITPYPTEEDDLVVLVNEEGLVYNLKPNHHFPTIVGDFVVLNRIDFK